MITWNHESKLTELVSEADDYKAYLCLKHRKGVKRLDGQYAEAKIIWKKRKRSILPTTKFMIGCKASDLPICSYCGAAGEYMSLSGPKVCPWCEGLKISVLDEAMRIIKNLIEMDRDKND